MVFDLLIPVYNEEDFLSLVVERCVNLRNLLLKRDILLNLIIVDDFSKDNSYKIAKEISQKYDWITVLKHNQNLGKGAALKTAFNFSDGDYIGIQDADLEYDPKDYLKLIEFMQDKNVNVVYGSRYLTKNKMESFLHRFVNKFLTNLFNVLNWVYISDMETCYKLFSKKVKENICLKLNEKGFGFEPEISSYIIKNNYKIYEVLIDYTPRNYDDGKKISFFDGVKAVYCILFYCSKKILFLYIVLFSFIVYLVK